MTPWLFLDCIGHQFSCWCLALVLVSLTSITSIHISSHLFCYSWSPVIPGNQLCRLLSPSVPSYWGVMVQLYYFPPEVFLQYVYPSFLHYYPILYFLFFIFQRFYSCLFQLFYCLYYLLIPLLYPFDSFL